MKKWIYLLSLYQVVIMTETSKMKNNIFIIGEE